MAMTGAVRSRLSRGIPRGRSGRIPRYIPLYPGPSARRSVGGAPGRAIRTQFLGNEVNECGDCPRDVSAIRISRVHARGFVPMLAQWCGSAQRQSAARPVGDAHVICANHKAVSAVPKQVAGLALMQ